MSSIILEASAYQKKYKCPYCNHRDARAKLVSHIEEKHQDMVPKGYTATRVVFNMINKKEHGSCIICRKETKWDENKARYERICERKQCHDTYVKQAHTNTDIVNKLRDPEFQQKMLAGRSISGNYKFADGGLVSYTGSYEKQLLEFLDVFLKVKSYDIDSPGPVIEYEYNGQKHFWITDQYYIPYNLVFDVKDGGDNPNQREMGEYRLKQIAKEKAIKDQGKYNYIRLTNNDFEQLIDIMLELKETFMDNDKIKKPIIRINENSNMAISALPPANANNVYIVNYLKKNQFTGEKEEKYAICKDYMHNTITISDGELQSMSMDELKDIDEMKVFQYNGDANFNEVLEAAEEDTDFYTIITGRDLLDSNQLLFDKDFTQVIPYSKTLKVMEESIKINMEKGLSPCNESFRGIDIPYFVLESDITDEFKKCRDLNGVFIMDELTGIRSKSYGSINEIYSNGISVILKNIVNNISNASDSEYFIR